ncbi:tumor protein D52 isoform X2 [Salmo salar]|uniref:Tumor protein D52 isoform X2 n=1 Tax=Salmo salar TaxID=8030 RepID=A0A1S3Q1C1_SALSA|nr:tumor protein D52 isoform X2 [Salmo salar]|eukprot:XP_014033676.1 PREDICTED: tumor protein D52 isoform X2 [Salmo salar]
MDALEQEYKSPFDFEQGVNSSYLYLSPSFNVTPPGSPHVTVTARGAVRPDSITEVGEDAVMSVTVPPSLPTLTEEEQEELRDELLKVEDEVVTLSQVLAAKEKQVADLKRKLGITPLNELKQNISKSWQEVTTSTAYKKTSEGLSVAGQKATAAFTSVGSAISRKFEDVSIRSLQHSASMPVMRNTPTFKSFEEKVETLKVKMSPTASQGDFGDVLTSTATSDPTVPVEKRPEATPIATQEEQPH